ncbi:MULTISPECIES: glycosyltransferase [unclassified Sulfitobacter]|uniref:glycosyltransferase n=1 Tax=unclassified Sulfitobacter TaxID=196795 RepID=UPI0007C3A2A2|nr:MULTISPECIES: glycosyltransferase [unclassified Sulfitobacter]KZX94664.1 colanic acid biosynthesis glycosyltransferase WcaL [Sulfitobacter sp. HI0023]KZY22592.1 colanic acid biosynthesis glycosyltransferase WcaL [Sulfitobacter sp. HI0040]KZZ67461.1 colanic acid biosynthesis glycosyltransferase WcaL [Sulfitobacter sp. HI0129]
MHIAYILNTYPQPSHSFIRREIRALEAQGHQVSRIAMRGPDAPLVDAQDRAEAERTEHVLALGGAELGRASWRRLRTAPREWWSAARRAWALGRASETGVLRHMIYLAEAAVVAERCADMGADHAHAHFGTNAATVAMLARIMGGLPYSFTVHGPEEFDSPRALSLGEKIARAAFTVAISQYGRSQLCRWADPEDWDRIKVVHCGIDPSRFAALRPLTDGPRRILSIGRFVEQKGQLALIEAMGKLRHPTLHLTLVGDGEMRPRIRAAIARHGLEDRVTLTGWVDEARIEDELAASHALVMPSFAEGLPMVVMEAMAAARPVIATYVAGTPELVLHGQTGRLVPAGDTQALCTALQALADAPLGTLDRMGRAGRARVFVRHDVNSEAAKLAAHFADV